MLNGNNNENGKKSKGLIQQKKQLCTCSTLFLYIFFYHCFAQLEGETSQFIHVLLRKRHMYSCSFFLFGTHFHLGGGQHVSFSQRLYKIFLFSFRRNSSPFYFIFRFTSFFCYPPQCRHQDLVQKEKKTYSDLRSFFLSKSLGGHAIYRQKRAGARNANFLPTLMKGWTYVCPYVRVRDFDRTSFLTHGAPLDSSSIISLKLFTNSQFGV